MYTCSLGSLRLILSFTFFFFNDTATTEIYTLSLHDALPILDRATVAENLLDRVVPGVAGHGARRENPAQEVFAAVRKRGGWRTRSPALLPRVRPPPP